MRKTENELIVPESVEPLDTCPFCGSTLLHRYGNKRQRYRDLPQDERTVIIEVTRGRWLCEDCERYCEDRLSAEKFMTRGSGSRMTRRLYEYIRERCARGDANAEIARDTGLGAATVLRMRKRFGYVALSPGRQSVPETPEVQ